MEKPIRVRLLGRDYPLRVREEDEAFTREVAAYVEERFERFRDPARSETTVAVIAALSLAEELFHLRESVEQEEDTLVDAILALDLQLAAALTRPGPDGSGLEDRPSEASLPED